MGVVGHSLVDEGVVACSQESRVRAVAVVALQSSMLARLSDRSAGGESAFMVGGEVWFGAQTAGG